MREISVLGNRAEADEFYEAADARARFDEVASTLTGAHEYHVRPTQEQEVEIASRIAKYRANRRLDLVRENNTHPPVIRLNRSDRRVRELIPAPARLIAIAAFGAAALTSFASGQNTAQAEGDQATASPTPIETPAGPTASPTSGIGEIPGATPVEAPIEEPTAQSTATQTEAPTAPPSPTIEPTQDLPEGNFFREWKGECEVGWDLRVCPVVFDISVRGINSAGIFVEKSFPVKLPQDVAFAPGTVTMRWNPAVGHRQWLDSARVDPEVFDAVSIFIKRNGPDKGLQIVYDKAKGKAYVSYFNSMTRQNVREEVDSKWTQEELDLLDGQHVLTAQMKYKNRDKQGKEGKEQKQDIEDVQPCTVEQTGTPTPEEETPTGTPTLERKTPTRPSSPTPGETETPTGTPTPKKTPTSTSSPTPEKTGTTTNTPTGSPTPEKTERPTGTPTPTPSRIATLTATVRSTVTRTATATATRLRETATATATKLRETATATATRLLFTRTPSPTPKNTPTGTSSPTPEDEKTLTPPPPPSTPEDIPTPRTPGVPKKTPGVPPTPRTPQMPESFPKTGHGPVEVITTTPYPLMPRTGGGGTAHLRKDTNTSQSWYHEQRDMRVQARLKAARNAR